MANSKGRLKLMKRNSRAQIILAVRKNAPISRVKLAKITGHSLSCVGDIVEELLLDGTLVETGTAAGPRGRPMILLDINPNGAPAVGVWLGPEEIQIVVSNPAADILARRNVSYECPDEGAEQVLPSIIQAIYRCVEAAGKDMKSVRGVGVSVAGLVDPILGVIDNLTNRSGWEDFPIVRLLEMELHVPVHADNDVRAAALAYQWLSDQAKDGSILFMSITDGVGAAYVHNGELLRGVHDAAGLVGHTTLDVNGPVCGCGNRGCLETLISDVAFIRNLWPDLVKNITELTTLERKQLVESGLKTAMSGDAKANLALTTVTKFIGTGVANAIGFYDPALVLIGGTLIDYGADVVIDLIRRETMHHTWKRARGVEIRACVNIEEFLLHGSVGLVLLQPYKALYEDNMRARAVK